MCPGPIISATLHAADTFIPEEPPTNNPSSFNSRRDYNRSFQLTLSYCHTYINIYIQPSSFNSRRDYNRSFQLTLSYCHTYINIYIQPSSFNSRRDYNRSFRLTLSYCHTYINIYIQPSLFNSRRDYNRSFRLTHSYVYKNTYKILKPLRPQYVLYRICYRNMAAIPPR